jgi:hypothetical protein
VIRFAGGQGAKQQCQRPEQRALAQPMMRPHM